VQLFSQNLFFDRFVTEMQFALRQLGARPGNACVVRFGYGCRTARGAGLQPIPSGEHRVEPAALEAFVEESIRSGTFEPGESDLHVVSADGKIRAVFCHEADLHIATRESELVDTFRSRWAALGYGWHEAPSLPGEPSA
jgi:hypothetical protein